MKGRLKRTRQSIAPKNDADVKEQESIADENPDSNLENNVRQANKTRFKKLLKAAAHAVNVVGHIHRQEPKYFQVITSTILYWW